MTHQQLVEQLAKPGEDILKELTPEHVHAWHMATGACSEAGELLDAVKKYVCYNKPLDRENVVEEMGDIEFYLEGMRAKLGIAREEVLEYNIQKLLKRYPAGTFTNADAQARKDKS
jgi:NTP pyrophosphatase (non-canonical NTP hydrolase)